MTRHAHRAGPRRVLMLTPNFLPHVGGVERHVDGLAAQLARRGIDVTVVTVNGTERLPDCEMRRGYRLLRMPHGGRDAWRWLLGNLGLIVRSDLVHCHDYSTFFSWYLPFRFLLPWIPVYVTFHGFEKYPPDSVAIRRRKLTALLSRGYLCVGRYIERWYGTPCSRVILGATCLEHVPSNDERENRVVFVGRMEPDTAPEGLIMALSILKREFGISLEAHMCGDGSLRPALERLAASRNVGVRFHGFVEDIRPIVAKSRFAVPGGYLSMLEAMALGAAVVVYAPNPLRQDYWSLPGLTGRIFLVASTPDELASNLANLIANTSTVEGLVTAGIRFARTQTWDGLADAYLHLYET